MERNELQVYVTALDKLFECKYVDRKTTKVDYVRLAEILSEEMYASVVENKASTYLRIAPVASKKSKSREKPVKGKDKPDLPSGSFMK
jgi:hypothetical protein